MDESKEMSLVLYAHDHTQGYGSFDFLPQTHRRQETQQRRAIVTQTVPDRPFPFKRLPIEVRNHIYKILVSSMLDTADNYFPQLSVAPRIRFTLRSLEWQPNPEHNYDYDFKVTSRYSPDDPRNDPNHVIDLYKALKDGSFQWSEFSPQYRSWKKEMLVEAEEVEEEEYDGETTDSDDFDFAEIPQKRITHSVDFMTPRQVAWNYVDSIPIPPRSKASDSQESSGEDRSSTRESLSQGDEMGADVDEEINDETRDSMVMGESLGKIQGVEEEEEEEEEEEVEKESQHDAHEPERGFKLEIDYNQHTAEDHLHTERAFHDYEEVRCLTHVSRQFSREVGACLWHNSVLELEDYEIPSLFIKNRPAALQHVKGIVLNIYYDRTGCLNSSTADLERLFNWISQNLKLRFIMINLRTQLAYVWDFGKPGFDVWTKIFRRSKPMERFHVRVVFDTCSTPHSYVIKDSSVQKRLGEGLGNLWKPDCLREVESAEKTAYVQSRPT